MNVFENALQYFGFAFLVLSLIAAVADGIVTLAAKIKQLMSPRGGASHDGRESAADPRAWGDLVKAIGDVKMWLALAFVGAGLTMVAPITSGFQAQIETSRAAAEETRAKAYLTRAQAEALLARGKQ